MRARIVGIIVRLMMVRIEKGEVIGGGRKEGKEEGRKEEEESV